MKACVVIVTNHNLNITGLATSRVYATEELALADKSWQDTTDNYSIQEIELPVIMCEDCLPKTEMPQNLNLRDSKN